MNGRIDSECRFWKVVDGSGKNLLWRFSQKCEKRLVAASCLSVRPHGTTRFPHDRFFMKYDLFRKSVEKIQVSLRSHKNSVRFCWLGWMESKIYK